MELLKEVIQIYGERSDWFIELFFQHIALCVTAILLSGTIGLFIGIFISEREKLAPVVLGFTNVCYTIPSISLLGMLIPILGIGDKTAITALTIYGIMPMVKKYLCRY